MKKLLLCLSLMGLCSIAMAKGADITGVNEPTVVWVSSYTWTSAIQVSTTTAGVSNADCGIDNRRIAIKFDLPSGATDQFLILMSPDESSPDAAITVGDLYSPGDPPWIYSAGPSVYFYIRCLGTGPGKIIYQQLRGSF